MIIAFILILCGVWFGLYQYQNSVSQTLGSQSIKSLQEENRLFAQQLKAEINQLKIQNLNVTAESNAKMLALQQEIDMLSKNQKETTFEKPSFALQEIADIIRYSHEQLEMTRNVAEVIRLLTLAEKKEVLQDPLYSQLKNSLEQDIAALQAIPVPDINKIWFGIDTLITKIDILPKKEYLRQFLPTNEKGNAISMGIGTENSANKPVEGPAWQQRLIDSLIQFKDIIKIQRHEKPIEPLLSDIELLLETERLKLMLEQARLALLQRDQTIYDLTLKNALQSLSEYFKGEDPEVQSAVKSLKEFSNVLLNPQLPTLNSLKMLQNLNIRP